MSRGRPFKCPFCGSSNNGPRGYRITKTLGKRRIRVCRDCKRRFTPNNQKQQD